MKKIYTLIFYLFIFLPLFGGTVDSLEIAKVVNGFVEMTWSGEDDLSIESIRSLPESREDEYLVAVVELEPQGWVLVSADDLADPILGYSFESDFDGRRYRENSGLHFLLKGHKNNIKKLRETSSVVNPKWEQLKRREGLKSTSPSVAPLIDVEWNQSTGWNASSPEDPNGPGGHVYVGCVGVSMAQAMTVFEYPSKGAGKKTYTHTDYGTLTVNFDSYGNYNWVNMRTDSPNSDIADLLYHCAVSVEMDFGADGSGARTRTAASALKQYFSYSSTVNSISRISDDEEWIALLNDELTSNRSVIYSGDADNGQAGHAFNIDGVSSNGFYHLNWGWSGSNNGYYNINNLAPGSDDFTKNQAAIVGIKPIEPMPTDISLTKMELMEGRPEGTVVGNITVEDEASDNEYEFIVRGRQNIFGEYTAVDFYEEDQQLKTKKTFDYIEGEENEKFLSIKVTDKYGNELSEDFYIKILKDQTLETSISTVSAADDVWYDHTTEYIYFDSNHPVSRDIKLFDLTGKLVKNLVRDGNSFNVSQFPRGVYVLIYKDVRGSDKYKYFKFIRN